MDGTLFEQKAALRTMMRARLGQLSPEEHQARSVQVALQLVANPFWAVARRVLLFAPLPVEPDLDLLWLGESLAGKQCAYPRVEGTTMRLYFVEHVSELEPTRWGLREPVPVAAREADVRDFDLILVPGLAFDQSGGRLGRGGGFYDRLLADRDRASMVVGVAFEFQVVAQLPHGPHDAKLDCLCTD